jgi:hypothetical protein
LVSISCHWIGHDNDCWLIADNEFNFNWVIDCWIKKKITLSGNALSTYVCYKLIKDIILLFILLLVATIVNILKFS